MAVAPMKQAIAYSPLPIGVPSLVIPSVAPRKSGRAPIQSTAITPR